MFHALRNHMGEVDVVVAGVFLLLYRVGVFIIQLRRGVGGGGSPVAGGHVWRLAVKKERKSRLRTIVIYCSFLDSLVYRIWIKVVSQRAQSKKNYANDKQTLGSNGNKRFPFSPTG